jgi:replicative DNA helicase
VTIQAEARPHAGGTPQAVAAAEKTLLGAMIQSRTATEQVSEILTPGDFADANRRLVFEATVSLAGDGEPVDPAAVLARIGELEPGRSKMAPDGLLLAGLMEHACAAPVAIYHAQMVRKGARLRRLGEVASRLAQRAANPAGEPEAIIDATRAELDALLDGSGDEHVATAADLLDRVLDNLERPLEVTTAVPTGLADVDDIIPGLRPGQMIVIGARPSTGKSTLALDIARHAAIKLGYPVAFASVEMDHDEVMHRLIAAEARVSLETLLAHKLGEHDWQRIERIRDRVHDSVLVIDDAPDTGLTRIRVRLRRMAATTPARLLIVDYLQLLKTVTTENRQQAVAELSRGLKLLAREFRIPVVVCAQLNRAPEQRHDKRPVPSDLRESGAIEADSDVILLLHREELHDAEKRPGEIDVIVAKHRQGRLGIAPLAFQGEFGCCMDLAKPGWTPSASLGGPA